MAKPPVRDVIRDLIRDLNRDRIQDRLQVPLVAKWGGRRVSLSWNLIRDAIWDLIKEGG